MNAFGPEGLGRALMALGGVLFAVGLALTFFNRIPGLGRLPGDIVIQRGNFTLYFPIVTSLLLSALLSMLFWLFRGR